VAQSKYELLKRLAKEREDKAAERMRRAQARLADANGKLSQLDLYRQEYETRFAERSQAGMSAAQWVDFKKFIARIAEAVTMQQKEVEVADQRYQVERENWQEQHKQVAAFDKLIEREKQQAALKEAKREQKSTDEFAARQYRETRQH
jgi:flagellar FliJ protein